MIINRFTDRSYAVNNTAIKLFYVAPEDLPIFKIRLVGILEEHLAETPEANTTIIIPLFRGASPFAESGGVALRLSSPLALMHNSDIIESICDICASKETCVDKSPRVLTCKSMVLQ